jgi:hypothetical protein
MHRCSPRHSYCRSSWACASPNAFWACVHFPRSWKGHDIFPKRHLRVTILTGNAFHSVACAQHSCDSSMQKQLQLGESVPCHIIHPQSLNVYPSVSNPPNCLWFLKAHCLEFLAGIIYTYILVYINFHYIYIHICAYIYMYIYIYFFYVYVYIYNYIYMYVLVRIYIHLGLQISILGVFPLVSQVFGVPWKPSAVGVQLLQYLGLCPGKVTRDGEIIWFINGLYH